MVENIVVVAVRHAHLRRELFHEPVA
jgi:hypothetical protein